MSNTIKRKVKPLEWFKENCEKDGNGDFIDPKDGSSVEEFVKSMFCYCGDYIFLDKNNNYHQYKFEEWMLEPLEEESNIDKLWSVLSDEIVKIIIDEADDIYFYKNNDNCDYDSIHITTLNMKLKQGTYYRPGHEPKLKKIPLTAEDLDKRSDLRFLYDDWTYEDRTVLVINKYDNEGIFYFDDIERYISYSTLSEQCVWLDNEGCWKYDK